FVEASAQVIGDVELAEEVGVWFTSVIRGDVNVIRIGRGSNIQDGTVIHVNRRGPPTIVEEYVTVGHGVRLHGCHIKSHCLIGIGAVVLDGAVLEEECLVAAGAVLSPGTNAPRGSVLMGAPARVKRQVTEADLDLIHRSARNYVALAAEYKAMQGG
ncbi:MAG: gamma carbonic anhydrase family protein, partial [Candidatus Rokubacteria bacterium RIFCSPLOWO2_12_FULL_71_19]